MFRTSLTFLIVGPIVGALINKYGCRVVGIAGSLALTTSFILSIFSPNIEMMIVTYGLIGGKYDDTWLLWSSNSTHSHITQLSTMNLLLY